MHVISRKMNESIVIADGISVTVIDIRGDKVRLGVEAPPDVSCYLKEVRDKMRGAGLQNCQSTFPSLQIELTSCQCNLLDCIGHSIRSATGEEAGRGVIVAEILNAAVTRQEELACATSLDELRTLLAKCQETGE